MNSPPYHLPTRLLASPTRTTSLNRSQPSTPQQQQDEQFDDMEMSPMRAVQVHVTPPEQRHLGTPSIYMTPPQEHVVQFPSPGLSRTASPKPLILSTSNLHEVPARISGQYATSRTGLQKHLLPSPIGEEDPFHDSQKTIPTPPGQKSAFDQSPPPTPASAKSIFGRKQPKGPPPLYKPSLKLLFSLAHRRDVLTLLLPACLFSCAAGLVPPYMTFVLGDAFEAFANYQRAIMSLPSTLQHNPGDQLKKDMIIVAVKLIVLGVLAVIFTTIALSLWVWHGERIAKRIRTTVYIGISKKPMAWFDLGMGKRVANGDTEEDAEGFESESSGGLMGRFARETDDVRMALSAVGGRLTISVCTFVACIVIAFWHSWALTLVILGSAPLIVLATVAVEVIVTPIMMLERNLNASAAARVERTTAAIATVKVFNAETEEIESFVILAEQARRAYNRITMLWGLRAGFVQFLLLVMFVSGFWFGNYLVGTGRKTAGDVTIVFWATLLASSNMQMCLPMLNIVEKAKTSMAALLETAHDSQNEPASSRPLSNDSSVISPDADRKDPLLHISMSNTSPTLPTFIPVQTEKARIGHRRTHSLKTKKSPAVRPLKRMAPERFSGELVLKDITFWYPSRPAPAPPALHKVDMYLPARETTYIVGSSGSGKSTIGSLLLGLYKAEQGHIEADEQGTEWLDEKWLRSQIGMVSHGASVLFEGTVHENVALGIVGTLGSKARRPEDVTREEVVAACRAALFHDFVRDLPDGYDTMLSGEKGASLSGGQRQRLAIARAYIRDPTVLVLDEATSALDVTSRQLVHAALKAWRRNKTTIIITHDLSPITPDDFVYVMRDGEVVEQGYRQELESKEDGWFHHLAQIQAEPDGDVQPVDDIDNYYEATETLDLPDVQMTPPLLTVPQFSTPQSVRSSYLTPNGPNDMGSQVRAFQENRRASQMYMSDQVTRRASFHSGLGISLVKTPPRKESLGVLARGSITTTGSVALRPPSMQRSPSSQSSLRKVSPLRNSTHSEQVLQRAGLASSVRRQTLPSLARSAGPRDSWAQLTEVKTKDKLNTDGENHEIEAETPQLPPPSLYQIFRLVIPMVPSKIGLAAGLAFCIASGVCTPLFSNLFATLLSALSAPGSINLVRTALILLLIALVNGLADWWKYTMLQHVAMGWVVKLQKESFGNVMYQSKGWFDSPDNAPINIVTKLIKDAEDARSIIGVVAGNLTVIFTMLILGVVWAFAKGWQLTLVGLSLGPLFVISTMVSSRFLGAYERLNKVEREVCAKRFYQTVSNIKAIRSMSLETVFLEKFDDSVTQAYRGGKKSAFFTGFGTGVAFFVIYVAQAIMFLVGAIFIAKGIYTFEQMLQVFVLLIFSVTFSSQVLSNIPQITKAKYAAIDLLAIQKLSMETTESQGRMTFPVTGHIAFDKVSFSYPTRPDAPVLDGVSFEIKAGECVGIVGPSGSGKSTTAALLQRLYEPASGVIRIDGRPLPRVDVKYLRDHVAVISQHPALFDMSVSDNISYGADKAVSQVDIERAAKQANVHEFIMTLPEGYKTHLGENAGLISGGQAQRLQIARALLRPREILLGDEITSALDAENQDAVMKTILDIAKTRTTVLITHKVATMKLCDRLILMENGRVVFQGTFDELMKDARGMFATLATSGELQA